MEGRKYTNEQFEEFKSLINGQFRGYKEYKNYPLYGIKRIFEIQYFPFSHQISIDVIDDISLATEMINCFRKGHAMDLYFEEFVNMLNKFEY